MGFRFAEEQEALRREFDNFFREVMKEAPEDWGWGPEALLATDEGWAFHRKVQRKLAEKG